METRYLYVGGVFKDPIANEEDEDIDDEKSCVSALKNKTSKSTMSKSGKALNKLCLLCDKKISGNNWAANVWTVHNNVVPSFEKLTNFKGKYKNSGALGWRSYLAGRRPTQFEYYS